MSDRLHRFLIEGTPARGALVRLAGAYREVLERHAYPPVLQRLLGELLAASVLMSGNIKFRGSLIMQLQGQGPLSLMVVECAPGLQIRAMAQWREPLPAQGQLAELAGNGRFALSLDPKDGGQIYQGIVELAGGSAAEQLEHYLARSEQLPSRLVLGVHEHEATGLLLQRLPGEAEADEAAWRRLEARASSIDTLRLARDPIEHLLPSIFPEDDIRLFSPEPVAFHCPCSQERVASALRLLGEAETREVLAERGSVEAVCEFCNRRYVFDTEGIGRVFAPSGVPPQVLH